MTISIEEALRAAAAADLEISVIHWTGKYWDKDEKWHCTLELRQKIEIKGAGPEVIQQAWLQAKAQWGL